MSQQTIETTGGELYIDNQPEFRDTAISTLNCITWLEKQLAKGQQFSLYFRDSSFEHLSHRPSGESVYVDNGIEMERALKRWAQERGFLRNWLIASGGSNYGDAGEISFQPRTKELMNKQPHVGMWSSAYWLES